MMLLPDVNVLIYAHRHDERLHAPYRRWLDTTVGRPEPFALSALVAVAFVRIVTNPKVYKTPTPLTLALAAMDALIDRENCRWVTPGFQHWKLVAEACRSARAIGKLVADAQHAAVCLEHGCTFVTRDGDFAAFEPMGLRWQHLVLEPPTARET